MFPSLEVLFHPLRLRIIQVLASGRQLTAGQLTGSLPDVPPATLYRHLNSLVEGGLLVVVEERRVRNLTEKVYALKDVAIDLEPESSLKLTKDDLLRLFAMFVASHLDDFQRYMQRQENDRVNFQDDGVTFWQRSIYLTNEEAWRVAAAMSAALPAAEHPPDPSRQRRLISVIMMPATDDPVDDTSGS